LLVIPVETRWIDMQRVADFLRNTLKFPVIASKMRMTGRGVSLRSRSPGLIVMESGVSDNPASRIHFVVDHFLIRPILPGHFAVPHQVL
jgi:hypothetical protein